MQNNTVSKIKIAIIDDNKDLVDFVKPVLESHNYEVIAAYSGSSGLEAVKSHKPDVIILDIVMPDMNGNDVLFELKKGRDTKDIPVIMFTVKEWQYDRSKSLELGAYEYISKPFDSHMLLRQINNVLRKKERREL